ncbi:4Fe-4S dicluster domain-containing protein [Bradyrhizobium sp. HKCCYLRH1065]|uniref:4Fe-4S dicluster domain-containing protein n=1 Tax=Bradyrhizobium sp. HKCCYLRH1065 TaxID=3420753 RepID=UPI003EBF42CC
MSKWHLIIDVALCENCGNCQLAAKDEYVGNDFPGYSAPHPARGLGVVRVERTVRGSGAQVDAAYLPRMCNHCADAPCIKAAPDAIRRRDDGIVVIDPVKAKGRRDIVAACPYGAVIWNAELQLPQNWIFDAHLLDQGWKEPRCQQACPTGAIIALKIDDAEIAARTRTEQLDVLQPELGAGPRVHYRNLYRVTKHFITGSVFAKTGDLADCVEGATVTLERGGTAVDTTTTDAFGDFKFDRLEPGSGRYRVRIEHTDSGSAAVDAVLADTSVALGAIVLTAG